MIVILITEISLQSSNETKESAGQMQRSPSFRLLFLYSERHDQEI